TARTRSCMTAAFDPWADAWCVSLPMVAQQAHGACRGPPRSAGILRRLQDVNEPPGVGGSTAPDAIYEKGRSRSGYRSSTVRWSVWFQAPMVWEPSSSIRISLTEAFPKTARSYGHT